MGGEDEVAARRSPLAMVVLALLAEEPMHVYRMQHVIRERAKDTVVNVGSRNSLHQVVVRLVRDGLAEVGDVSAVRSRTTYAITQQGANALDAWLEEMVARPREEYPEFPAALAFAAFRHPLQLAEHLERRRSALAETLSAPGPEQVSTELGLPRVFLLEDEYKRAMVEAELAWVEEIIGDLRAGTLSWPAVGIVAGGARPPH